MLLGCMQGADSDFVKILQKKNACRFDNVWLKAKTVGVRADEQGVWAQFEGEGTPDEEQRYDLILQAVGRRPNGSQINAEAAGVAVDERRSEEHTSELQSRGHLVCRLLLEKKKRTQDREHEPVGIAKQKQ